MDKPFVAWHRILLIAVACAFSYLGNPSKAYGQSVPPGYVNVMDYGATGDGQTDDSAAIIKAIQSASARNLGVYFPNGNYLHMKSLPVNVSLQGASSWAVLIAGDPNNGCGLVVQGNNLTFTNLAFDDVTYYDITKNPWQLPFPADPTQGIQTNAITIQSSQSISLNNVWCRDLRSYGLLILQSQNVVVNNFNSGGFLHRGAGGGIVIANSNNVQVTNCQLAINGVSISGVQYSQNLSINHNSFYASAILGLRVKSSQFNYNVFSDQVNGPGLNIEFAWGPIVDVEIKGNQFSIPPNQPWDPTDQYPYAIVFVNLDYYGAFLFNGIDISDNTIDGVGSEICILFYGVFTNVSIKNNKINHIEQRLGGYPSAGIVMLNTINAVIAQNTMTDIDGTAITFTEDPRFPQTCSVLVSGNTLKNCCRSAIPNITPPPNAVMQFSAGAYTGGNPVFTNNTYLGNDDPGGGDQGSPDYFIYCDQPGATANGNAAGTLPSYFAAGNSGGTGGGSPGGNAGGPGGGGGGSGGGGRGSTKHGLPYHGSPRHSGHTHPRFNHNHVIHTHETHLKTGL
jgi:hypothetical protein